MPKPSSGKTRPKAAFNPFQWESWKPQAARPERLGKRKLEQTIVTSAEAYRSGQGWGETVAHGSRLPKGMKRLIRKKEIRYLAPGEEGRIVAKQIISAKTDKPVAAAGGRRTVRFKIQYENGDVWISAAFKPSKAEILAFQALQPWKDPRLLEGGPKAQEIVYRNCLTVERGGPYATTRDAVDALIRGWNMPLKGFFEVLIFWQVWADKDRKHLLDAPPSKRFMVNAAAMHKGYKRFLRKMKELKMEDLADMMKIDVAELKAEYGDVIRDRMKYLKEFGDLPKTATKAFIEKQILSIAQGRGVYISDKSMFKDFSGRRDRRRKKRPQGPQQAVSSEICIRVWKAADPRRKKRRKKKGASHGKVTKKRKRG